MLVDENGKLAYSSMPQACQSSGLLLERLYALMLSVFLPLWCYWHTLHVCMGSCCYQQYQLAPVGHALCMANWLLFRGLSYCMNGCCFLMLLDTFSWFSWFWLA